MGKVSNPSPFSYGSALKVVTILQKLNLKTSLKAPVMELKDLLLPSSFNLAVFQPVFLSSNSTLHFKNKVKKRRRKNYVQCAEFLEERMDTQRIQIVTLLTFIIRGPALPETD